MYGTIKQLLNVGNPHDEQTTMGALISEQHLDKVLSYVDAAAREGAVVVGGKRMKIGEVMKTGEFK